MFQPNQIPGMTEPVEQEMLTALAASDFVARNGAIVEFGTFFGRSTACLVNGAARWWSPESGKPAVHTFDSFGCADGQGFAVHVRSFAQMGNVGHLVKAGGGRADFRAVYDHFVGAAESQGILKSTTTEMRDAVPPDDRIALMHIDCPKFYDEMKYILFRFFPALAPGAVVIFQDYFYHWSATLIAATQLLTERGIFRLEQSRASSAMGTILRTPDIREMLELDLAMTGSSVVALIDRAIEAAKKASVDRPAQFIPRLHLAKVQYLWDKGEFAKAQQAFIDMIGQSEGNLIAPVFTDFLELMRHGFSIRRLYELDHHH